MRRFGTLSVLASVIAVSAATAEGSEITFSAYTDACFYSGGSTCTPSSSQTSTLDSLSFTENMFGGTSSGGTLLLEGANALGFFTHINGENNNYANNNLLLLVTFTVPAGSGGTTLSAAVSGKPKKDANDETIGITFNNTAIPFTFDTGLYTGSFSLIVNDLSFGEGATGVPLTGSIINATQTATTSLGPTVVPEPASLVLFGTGLTLIAARLRRRARASNN